jgi:hypothetical protein
MPKTPLLDPSHSQWVKCDGMAALLARIVRSSDSIPTFSAEESSRRVQGVLQNQDVARGPVRIGAMTS